MPIRDIFVTLVVFGSLPFILYRPYIGVYMWAWLSYMNPHRMTWGFAYNFPFAQSVALALFASLLFSKMRKPFPWTGTSVVWVLLIGWMCVTTLTALNPDLAVTEWGRTMKIQALAIVTVLLITEKRIIHGFAWVVTLSIIFFGVKGGIFILMRGGEGKVYGPMDSFFEDNNALAITLLMVIPLLVYLTRSLSGTVKIVWINVSAKLVRKALWCAVGLSMVSVLFTHSRGALLTMTAMVGLALLKMKRRGLLLVALLVSVPVAISYLPDEWFDRMQTIQTYEEDTSATGRINAWYFAYYLTKDHPIVGGGFDTFTPELFKTYAPDPDHFQDSHSIYFEMLGEHGYVGLILFLMLGFMSYSLAGRLGAYVERRTANPEEHAWIGSMGIALQFGIVAYAIGGAFLGLAYFDLYYHLIGMTLVLYRHIGELQPKPEERHDAVPNYGPRRMGRSGA